MDANYLKSTFDLNVSVCLLVCFIVLHYVQIKNKYGQKNLLYVNFIAIKWEAQLMNKRSRSEEEEVVDEGSLEGEYRLQGNDRCGKDN